MSEPGVYSCAQVTDCLSIAGSVKSPVCAILASRDHLVVKLWRIGKEKYMDRGNYEQYCNDRSVVEIMQDELDTICRRLMSDGDEAADGQDKGRAESLCWAIALIKEPFAPNMTKVKGQMMLRYEAWLREESVDPEATEDAADAGDGTEAETA